MGQIAEVQAKHGDFEKSKQTLLIAKTIAGSIKNPEKLASSLIVIVEAQAKSGDVEEAKKTAATIEYCCVDFILFKIADAQAKRGDVEEAKKTAQSINSSYTKGDALLKIAEAQLKLAKNLDKLKKRSPSDHG